MKKETNTQENFTELKKSSNSLTGAVQRINLDFTIYQHIAAGRWPAEIAKLLKWKKSRISYHTTSLIERGLIAFDHQGVWRILKEYEPKEFKKVSRVDSDKLPQSSNLNSFKADTDRAHAYQFKLQLKPNLKNWKHRETILKAIGLEYSPLEHLFGGGQGIMYRGRKIHLTDGSIIVYEPSSYFADKARQANVRAMIDVLKLIKALERELKADFSFKNGFYKIRITRQHHALIKNSLAGIYNKPKRERLEVYDGRGLWLLIDNSWQLEELECVSAETGVPDNEGIQGWMNSQKRTGFKVTPEFVLERFADAAKQIKDGHGQIAYFAEHMKSHVAAIQELGQAVKELREEYKKKNSEDKK